MHPTDHDTDHSTDHTTDQRSAVPARWLRVHVFAGMAAAAGSRTMEVAWEGGTVAGLRRRLVAAHPALAELLARSAVAIDDAYAPDDAIIPDGAAVAIIPPVSGG
jgi:molybdopterin converting factor small subunit